MTRSLNAAERASMYSSLLIPENPDDVDQFSEIIVCISSPVGRSAVWPDNTVSLFPYSYRMNFTVRKLLQILYGILSHRPGFIVLNISIY